MTLACGNAISVVEKLSTYCICAQSLVVSAISLSIVDVRTPMMERGARFSNCAPHLSQLLKDAA